MKRNITYALSIVFVSLSLFFVIPLPNPLFPGDYSMVVRDRDGKILRAFLNKQQQWCFPPDENLPIPRKLKKSILQYEDRLFYQHKGVNPFSLIRALYQNISTGKRISGASTLTMQLCRLMQPKARTLPNKLLEILQSAKIELFYSKEKILRQYLTHAPYGGNIIGYQAASLRYFGKEPAKLTWSEAAVLAVLPNSPALISPITNRNYLREKRNRLLTRMSNRGIIDQPTFRLAVSEPIPDHEIPFPLAAPHLAQLLKNRSDIRNANSRTTIDLKIQRQMERIVRQHADYLATLGIRNAAAIIVETGSGKIKAYVGSQDFFDAESGGQVDGIQSARSTGSILKPFLYALSFDDGIILPSTLLKDVPSYFGSFSPSNANRKYSGLVTAKEALVRSLNVPAVRLLFTYGYYSFFIFLKEAGLTTLFRPPDDYGLPLILGGAEANLWDLAKLYRGLGNFGKFSGLKIWERGGKNLQVSQFKQTKNQVLISPGASWLTLNILKELKRPGSEYYWEQYQDQWPLAWKTGTSYGQRDAWAVGVNPQWTIAVWAGNFDGEPNRELSGARCAGPILFDIFNSLPRNPKKIWFEKPVTHLKTVKICLETGFQAGENCPHPVETEAPLSRKPLRICPYHQTIFVNLDESRQVCSLCWKPGHYKAENQLVYPPDVSQYLRERGQAISNLPPHKESCPGLVTGEPLKIIYPGNQARLWVPREVNGLIQKVSLRAAHQKNEQTIFWYLDSTYLGETRRKHVKAVELPEGWHTLEVIDLNGNRDHTRFYVNRHHNAG